MNENEFNGMFFLSIVTLIIGSIGLALKMCYKSKCNEIKCCCIQIKRDTQTEKEEDLIFNNRSSENNSPQFNRI